jgi:hypothetical protein
MNISLTKYLWSALAGSLGIIVLLVSAWARDTTSRTTTMEQRMATAEQHYAAIQSDVQDLRDHMKEIEWLLQKETHESH